MGNLNADDEFSWLKAIEEAEKNSKRRDTALIPDEFEEDDSWLNLVDEAERKIKSRDQKVRKSGRGREGMKSILVGAAVIACVIAGGFAVVLGLTHTTSRNNIVAAPLAEENGERAPETTEKSETTDAGTSSQLTAEDQEAVAAGVAARKAEREKQRTENSSGTQERAEGRTDNTSQAATDAVTQETTADTYLEDVYNSYAALIQSESASLINQLQEGSIDYMTASQQLNNLYNTGYQTMNNYWMNGNCSYEDMTTWSNRLWSIYTVESPKLVTAGN